MKLLHFIALPALLLASCQSEYEHQLNKAKELVQQEEFLKNNDNGQEDLNCNTSLTTIRKEIEYCAHVSGNERFFLNEVNTYRKSVQDSPVKNEWITRYP